MLWKRVMGLVLVLVCSFVVFIPAHGYAEASLGDLDSGWVNPYAEFFNIRDMEEGMVGEERPFFLKYNILNFFLQFNPLWIKLPGIGPIYVFSNFLLSAVMLGMGIACLIVIYLSDWAFSYTGFQGLEAYVEEFVEHLRDKLFFGELFGVLIFFLGVSLIFSFGRNEDVAGKLLKVILNLVVAFTLMANMGSIIKGINAIGKYGSDAVFTAFSTLPGSNDVKYYDDNPGRDAMMHVYDSFFIYNFYKPWQLANYGLIVPDKEEGLTEKQRQVREDTREWLEANPLKKIIVGPFEEMGKNIFATVKTVINTLLPDSLEIDPGTGGYGYVTMTPLGIPFRFFIVMLTFVIGSAYGLLLLAIAGTTIFGKIIMLMLAMLSPLIFLLVLIPEWGDEILLNWVKGMIAAGTYWIVASLLLVIILFLQYQLYQISADNWITAMFLQCILLFTAFRFRNVIWEYIPIGQYAMMSAAETAFFEKGKEAIDKTKEMAIEGGAILALGGAAVATGNPAFLSGMGKGKLGAFSKQVFSDAAQIRGGANKKGNRIGMTKALRLAVAKQFGRNVEEEEQEKRQSKRNQTKQQKQQSQRDQQAANQQAQQQANQQMQQQAKQQMQLQAKIGDQQSQGAGDIDSAASELAAAIRQAAQQVRQAAEGRVYTEVGEQPVDLRSGEYAVFDQENNKKYTIRDGVVHDVQQSDKVIGRIQGNQVIGSDGRPVGTIQNGTFNMSSGFQGKVYQPQSAGQATHITKDVIVDVKAKAKNPVVEAKVDVEARPNQQKIKIDGNVVRPKIRIENPDEITFKPKIKADNIEEINVNPKFNLKGAEVQKIDFSTQTNVTQHNTVIGGGGDGKGGSSGGTPVNPSPTNNPSPTANIDLTIHHSGGGGTTGSASEKIHVTQNNFGETINVQTGNEGAGGDNSSSSSSGVNIRTFFATGTAHGITDRDLDIADAEDDRKNRKRRKRGGFLSWLSGIFKNS